MTDHSLARFTDMAGALYYEAPSMSVNYYFPYVSEHQVPYLTGSGSLSHILRNNRMMINNYAIIVLGHYAFDKVPFGFN